MRAHLPTAALVATCMLLASPDDAAAQTGCSVVTDSILACWQKFVPDDFKDLNSPEAVAERERNAAAAGTSVANEVLNLVTSPGVVGADAASAVTNFLPLLAFTGFGGNLSGSEGEGAESDEDLAFDVNLPFFGSAGANALKLQTAFARDREVYEPLLETIPEADRDRVKTAFDDDSTMGDDARFTVSYNLVSERFGRSFRQHRERFEQLYMAAAGDAIPGDLNAQFNAISDLLEAEFPDPPRPRADGSPQPSQLRLNQILNDWPSDEQLAVLGADRATVEPRLPGIRARILQLIEQAASTTAAFNAAEDERLASNRVLDFRDLVDNQPQLMFTLTSRRRDEMIGPNESSVGFTFELPLGGNLTGFARDNATACPAASWRSSACLEAFRNYVDNQSTIASMSPRFAVSLSYADVDDYSVALADPVVTFSRPGSKKLIASAAIGLRLEGDGLAQDARFDFQLQHEDVSDDPERNSRTIVSATWTKQFAGMAMPVTLIYANKPEFLDEQELGQRLSLNVGLKYELRQPE